MAVAETSLQAERPPWTAVLHEWTTTVDHKKIGILYVLMALGFLVVGGIEALLMRWQLFYPRNTFLQADRFNQLFTMHGTTMVFFVGMPLLIGMGNYLVPLMIGARDMAFPRLNAMGFWATFFGGMLVYFSFATGGAPAIGWFAYAPLTEQTFARTAATDFWALGLIVSGAGTIAGGVNFVATILGLRAPGLTLRKIPFFAWTILWTSVLILFAMPPLTAALVMVLLDRNLGAHFFDAQNGGSALLWQHLFWFFGHPEVYILILPVFGMVTEIIPVFSRKVLFGYEFMAAATAAIAFISMGVWAHHMFCVGMSRTLDMFFVVSSLLVSIPTGIKFFNWLATMYGGKISFASPMLFACGFLSMFLIGGLTGIMLAAAPFDFQLSDSYFVVGHFHWVLIGGTLFGAIGGVYYWYPKATGRMMSERVARWQFWLLYIGFLLTFGPMHLSGMLGMPRRIYTYDADRGWALLNQLTTLGAIIQLPSFALFFYNLVSSLWIGAARRRRPLGRLDAGMDDDLAAALVQLRGGPDGSQPSSLVGRQTPRRSGLEVRMRAPDVSDASYTGRLGGPASELPVPPSISPETGLTSAQWGMAAFLLSEVAFFSTLLAVYGFYMGKDVVGPTPGEALSLPLVICTTVLLLSSSATIHVAEKALRSGAASMFCLWWAATIVLGVLFLLGTGYEWRDLIVRQKLTLSRNLFGTTYYTLVGFHALHVTVGVTAMIIVLGLMLARRLTASHRSGVELVAWYWHFVDGVWVVVFTVVYLVGR